MLKRGKAAGYDGITTEMIKNLGTNGLEMLKTLYNRAWKEERIPKDWEIGILAPLFKKGDKRECANYRGITILSIIFKVYERILEQKLKTETESELEESQSGFRKGRGVQDHIFTIKQLVEKKTNDNIYLAFIDLEKAFDSIPRKEIWKSLKRRKINKKLRNNIMALYKNTRNCVRTNNAQSDEFITKTGLRQGGTLSPTLFNIVLDDVIKEVKGKVKKLQVGYKNMEMVSISESAFADDIVIYAKNTQDLQSNLEIWNQHLRNRNLKINTDKTKVMVIGKEDIKIDITLNGTPIEQTETFKYLGVKIHKNGTMDVEINDRIESAMKVYHAMSNSFIRKKEISTKTKLTIYKTIIKPILTYGSESWILTKNTKSKIQAVEMKYLRGVKGVTKRDKIRNEIIREELKVEPVLKSIEKQQLRWLGHVIRMKEERQVKKVWQARKVSKTRRGRPRKTWNEVVEEHLKQRNLSWREAMRLARNKKEWATFIYK